MADQPQPEKPPGKVDGKGKEPQKFLYLQLQQDRTGDGTGRVATLVGGRGGTGPAHFIPLTAKLNSISVLGSGPRASRGAVSMAASRTLAAGRKNSSSTSSTAVVTMATGRPVVATAVSVAPMRCGTATVSSPRPVMASPVTTVTAKSSSSTPIVRKAHTNVMVSSGITRPATSPSAATITVLGASGGLSGSAPVLRPNTSQGASPHPPVILHTSKVPQPSSSPSPGAGKGISPRLVPIPLTQVRTGVSNKAVLSYSALLQAGAGSGVGGAGLGGSGAGTNSSVSGGSNPSGKKEGHASPQPLLLQTASAGGVKGASPLAKTGAATISIITGKGGKQSGGVSGGVPKPVNMVAVNLGQTKSNMINFKISNGQIQADNLQPMDAVLRETRPVQSGGKRSGEEWKDAPKVVGGAGLAHAVGSGSVTVSVTGSVPAALKIPEPVIVPVTVPLPPPQSPCEPVPGAMQEVDGMGHLRDMTMTPTKRDKEDLLQRAVSTLGDVLEEEEVGEEVHTPNILSPPLTYSLEEEEEEAGGGGGGEKIQTILAKPFPQPLSPAGTEEVKVKIEDVETTTTTTSFLPKTSEDLKPELVKFSDLLKWEDGVGKMDGSELKFKVNEFNAVEIVEDRDLEELKIQQIKRTEVASTRHHARKPNYRDIVKDEDIFSDNSQDSEPQGNRSGKESYDICCCKNCGCYGLSSEFFRDSSFCSTACGDEHDARELEWGKERQRLEKERQRRRRLRQLEKAGEEEQAGGDGSDGEEAGSGEEEDKEEEGGSRFQHPWQDGKSSFSWVKYLEHCGRAKGLAKAAPLKLWPEPFPFGRNLFRTGMKLEAIDPAHQSLFCVMTVAEVIGHRLRLHFDGYSEQHDFWLNADSPNMFPAGWCEKNGRQLEPPLGVLGFSWKAYLEHCKAQTAPRQAFTGRAAPSVVTPNNFRVGMKLEAEDRKNAWVCVATVADVLDNRVLIHFDGWEKAYDVWSEVSSPYIHPVGWCSEAGVVLHPPNNYPSPESFNWHEYLQETNSMAVPARAFKTRPPRGFRQGMKVEAVDRRNPSLVRVATVADTQDYQVKVHFDGWGDEYDLWVDDDSPDLHPPSWCAKTCHPLQPPLTPEQQAEDVDAGTGCGTPGCKGVGHVKGPVYTTHHTAYGCPYSLQNLAKDSDAFITDRLSQPPERKKCKVAAPKVRLDLRPCGSAKGAAAHDLDEADGHKKRVRKRRKFFDELSPPEPNRPQKVPKLASEDPRVMVPGGPLAPPPPNSGMPPQGTMPPSTPSPSTSSGQQPPVVGPLPQQPPAAAAVAAPQADPGVDMMVHQSVFNPGYTPHPAPPPPHSWERHRHLTAPLGDARRSEVEAWSPGQVEELVGRIPGCEDVATAFADQQIDGEALLMMTQNDLVSLLHLKLGPAVKIMAVIMCLRSSP
ncbi:lethal(3)malignant brain tumor-like protein 3 [Eriocheir sinensis]|uniref:lethal(3)malignant brain tumor-like protein 3 n=1 Tax=Eriocheir sinensis TaxID=95602 RepID=UPI0021CA7095|nr:lethal(3)malignant brain tumor-like protein 3 [Eriocheir sinensis]XP_050692188.1 lethal(3)malignant brain tumor-like protein 3 [Eriocheir sinensis]XP_050692189.1 lethal(3)malignant brain tumor-like protein 3 [Eriocheir sinensis]XP_050692190.1 lethal(3)malignant brain tumor-like protein 3 [Eriocheir sinensis]XP_050692191.1 lethal(3)malignant brain tumor-like protein 3 [Eriocheir sinensis]